MRIRQSPIISVLRTLAISLLLFAPTLEAQNGATASAPARSLFFSFYFAPPPTDIMKAAPVYQGLARSDDRGTTWENLGWITSAVSGLAVDPRNAQRIVLATDYGVLGSLDGGSTWKLISAWNMPPVLAVRLRDAEIWAATARGIFVSSDHGSTWTARSLGLPSPDGTYVSDLVFTTDAMLAATADGVFRSTDRGASWFRSGMNGTEVFRIVAHPRHPELLAAIGLDRGAWVSTDGGRLWADRSEGLPTPQVKCAAFDPIEENTLLLGTANMGVIRSSDLGRKWELSGGGLTNFNITSLLFDTDLPDRVYAGAENGSFLSENRGKTWSAFSVRLGYISGMEMR